MQFVDELRQLRLNDLKRAHPWKTSWDVVDDVDAFAGEFLEGTLRINKVTGPCGEIAGGCNAIVPRLLPPNSRMWVEWFDSAGTLQRGYFEPGFSGLVRP